MSWLRFLFLLGGLVLTVGCGMAIYLLVQIVLSGAFSGIWIQVVAGILLLYLLLGFLGLGIVIGIYVIIQAITSDD